RRLARPRPVRLPRTGAGARGDRGPARVRAPVRRAIVRPGLGAARRLPADREGVVPGARSETARPRMAERVRDGVPRGRTRAVRTGTPRRGVAGRAAAAAPRSACDDDALALPCARELLVGSAAVLLPRWCPLRLLLRRRRDHRDA